MIPVDELELPAEQLQNVVRYQYHQAEAGRAEVHVEVTPSFGELDVQEIRAAYHERLGAQLDMSLKVVDKVSLADSGKLKRVVSEVVVSYPHKEKSEI